MKPTYINDAFIMTLKKCLFSSMCFYVWFGQGNWTIDLTKSDLRSQTFEDFSVGSIMNDYIMVVMHLRSFTVTCIIGSFTFFFFWAFDFAAWRVYF